MPCFCPPWGLSVQLLPHRGPFITLASSSSSYPPPSDTDEPLSAHHVLALAFCFFPPAWPCFPRRSHTTLERRLFGNPSKYFIRGFPSASLNADLMLSLKLFSFFRFWSNNLPKFCIWASSVSAQTGASVVTRRHEYIFLSFKLFFRCLVYLWRMFSFFWRSLKLPCAFAHFKNSSASNISRNEKTNPASSS